MTMTDSLSQKTARRLALHAQLLDGRTILLRGKEGVAQVIEHLGYVQIDTISVIERAHHHTLWARVPGYKPEYLHKAQAIERTIFEYWGHAASYLPMSDYRFYIPTMLSFHNPTDAWYRGWGEKYGSYLDPVLKRIRAEGPKAARDFANPSQRTNGPWWDWKPAKAALEMLFWRGELMISERRGFERIYDLTERVLPTGTDVRPPSPDELGRFMVRLGVEAHDGVFYALPKVLETVSRFRATAPRVCLLNPFDNLVISRSRLKQRFDFDYTLECYVPRNKRLHGYFVLPILFGERIAGRLDPKADRKTKTFCVRQLGIDPEFQDVDGLIPELGRALGQLARFNSCQTLLLENIRPKKLSAPLKKALALGMSG